ncbi:aminoglycoside phosphotransferase family protein [candidate division KSB1 bacterium]|nr:aminoglycoside phosphotransferase family protein [candidate division KSB1 bacterium]
MYSFQHLETILQFWGLKLKSLHPEIVINGSPERTEYRMVIEDNKERLYILEQIPSSSLQNKLNISKTLRYFYEKGITTVEPYLPDLQGNDIVEYVKQYWQIVPYIKGIPLSRPDYVFDEWRGTALANFLIDMKKHSSGLPKVIKGEVFSIKKYILDFMHRVKQYNPQLLPELTEIYMFLHHDFFKYHDTLPVAFCHGDFHALNVIWRRNNIRKVIDWEFMGDKPELYDVANMIGCLGMEEPKGLISGVICSFVRELQDNHFMTVWTWRYLYEYIISLRFAWLAEWLRKNDKEMIKLEIVYMFLLIDNRRTIERVWLK